MDTSTEDTNLLILSLLNYNDLKKICTNQSIDQLCQSNHIIQKINNIKLQVNDYLRHLEVPYNHFIFETNENWHYFKNFLTCVKIDIDPHTVITFIKIYKDGIEIKFNTPIKVENWRYNNWIEQCSKLDIQNLLTNGLYDDTIHIIKDYQRS